MLLSSDALWWSLVAFAIASDPIHDRLMRFVAATGAAGFPRQRAERILESTLLVITLRLIAIPIREPIPAVYERPRRAVSWLVVLAADTGMRLFRVMLAFGDISCRLSIISVPQYSQVKLLMIFAFVCTSQPVSVPTHLIALLLVRGESASNRSGTPRLRPACRQVVFVSCLLAFA